MPRASTCGRAGSLPGSTTRRNPAELVRRQAAHLVGLVAEDLREGLAHDPEQVMVDAYGITVTYVAASTSSRCSIDGTYTANPPAITVATSLSAGRERFSLLHELGHHLQRNDFDSIDVLNRAGKNRRTLEEDICDSFAAEILLPEPDVDDALDGQLPSAEALASLYKEHSASRAACCVRIAQRLRSSGYVLLTNLDGHVAFAATAGDALPLARGTRQVDELFAEALSGRVTRGKTRVTYPSQWQSPVYFGELLQAGDWVFGVLQDQPPSWQVVPLKGDELKPAPGQIECGHCGETFAGWNPPCERCHVRTCAHCGRCECTKTPAPRTCQGCWLLLAPSRFPDDGPFCLDCA